MNDLVSQAQFDISAKPAKLGFLGVGWIGRHRMETLLGSGLAQAAVIADASSDMRNAAVELAPGAKLVETLDDMLTEDLDGIVIATPSALHADQSIRALEAGMAVFCQKPLGRTADEVRAVVNSARKASRLLGVDLSYRHTSGMREIRDLLHTRQLGQVFAADLTFHNAYGPDKPWFYDRELSGGGCLIDLGVHLIDLALWALDFPKVLSVSSHLRSGGRPITEGSKAVEDYAVATLELEDGPVVRLACSWRLQAGSDCVIEASFHGTEGGATMRNVNGSFYDFTAERFDGTARREIASPPDAWGGRAAIEWAKKLGQGVGFDEGSERLIDVADIIDRIYHSSRSPAANSGSATRI